MRVLSLCTTPLYLRLVCITCLWRKETNYFFLLKSVYIIGWDIFSVSVCKFCQNERSIWIDKEQSVIPLHFRNSQNILYVLIEIKLDILLLGCPPQMDSSSSCDIYQLSSLLCCRSLSRNKSGGCNNTAPLQLLGRTSAGRAGCGTDLPKCVSAGGDFLRPHGVLPGA